MYKTGLQLLREAGYKIKDIKTGVPITIPIEMLEEYGMPVINKCCKCGTSIPSVVAIFDEEENVYCHECSGYTFNSKGEAVPEESEEALEEFVFQQGDERDIEENMKELELDELENELEKLSKLELRFINSCIDDYIKQHNSFLIKELMNIPESERVYEVMLLKAELRASAKIKKMLGIENSVQNKMAETLLEQIEEIKALHKIEKLGKTRINNNLN